MKFDWLQIVLIALAVWILLARSKDKGRTIDWPELAALAIITQVASALWQEA
jgi:hypothetical protein